MAESCLQSDVKIPDERARLLLELNIDILINILTLCSPQTLSAVSRCCKQLYAIYNTDVLWKYIIHSRYRNVSTSLMSHFASHKSLFKHYCYHRHQLTGLWVLHLPPYNTVLRISQSASNCLESIGLMPNLRSIEFFNTPMEYKQIAQFISKDHCGKETMDKYVFSCSGEFDSGETIKPLQSIKLTKEGIIRNLVCAIDPFALRGLENEGVYNRQRYELILQRHMNPTSETSLTKVVINHVCTAEPQLLTPGVYKGDYSAHGVELLLVFYQEGNIIAKKLAGDPYIPGDQISMKCSHQNTLRVTSPVALDLSQGGTLTCHLPPSSYPDKFIAQYNGEGQIAFTGYHNPSFCPGRMYVADSSTFVFCFYSPLFSFKLCKRCEDMSNECMVV